MNWNRVLIVGLGGFLGSALRYMISAAMARAFGDFPVGTLLVNVVGGLLMGFLMEASGGLLPMSDSMRVFLTTGILGGLTTFSTFSYETIAFLSEGNYRMGGLNAASNLFLALIACRAGQAIAQIL